MQNILGQILKTTIKLIIGKGVRRSYSQNGEDILIENLIDYRKNGFYVDVGAFHPIQYSNTYSLYRRGWTGIAIDPNPRAGRLFRIFRPRDKFIKAGISASKNGLKYHMFQDPAYNTMDIDQRDEWIRKGIKEQSVTEVLCLPLKDILNEHSVDHIDVLSVDVEGMDLEVLKSHDWRISTEIIVVESHKFDVSRPTADPIYSFLIGYGYRLYALSGFSLIFKK